MNKKLQIFISSTFEDLKAERQLVMEAILELGHIPAGMEYFVSEDLEIFEVIKQWIKESDAFILISGGRYGSINTKDSFGRSYTHLEYECAKKLNKPIKVLKLSNNYLQEKKKERIYSNNDLNNPKLLEFRKNLKLSNNVDNQSQIKDAAKSLINKFSSDLCNKNNGWIKYKYISDLLELHPNHVKKARKKININADYYLYYYSFGHNRFVYSTIRFSIKDNTLLVVFKNDIDSKGKPRYKYSGHFDIYDDYLYVEAKSITDNEKICMIIKMLPGKLNLTSGILFGQGDIKQAVATTVLISNDSISDVSVLENFRTIQSRIIIDDKQIFELQKG